jgi:hypothetical protein
MMPLPAFEQRRIRKFIQARNQALTLNTSK